MEKTKKFVSINLAALLISIFTMLVYFLCKNIIVIGNGEFDSTILFGIFEIVFVPFINILLINKCIDKKFEFEDFKKVYFKCVGITFITMLISHFITFFLVNFALYGTFYEVITALISYMIRMFLSFALIIGVISEEKIKSSIGKSIKFTCENIWKVIGYNLIFLLGLWCVNFMTKVVIDNFENLFTYLLSSFFIEIVNCTILITNLKIYLKNYKEKVNVKEVAEK